MPSLREIAASREMINEADVTLTDYGLAVEAALLAWLLYRANAGRSPIKAFFVWFYLSISLAALLGGTYHGFFSNQANLTATTLWRGVLVTIGVTAFTAWRIGALLVFSSNVAGWIGRIAALELVLYSLAAIFLWQSFAFAIVNYLPAVLFLTFTLGLYFGRHRESSTLVGLAGLLLTFVAASVQHFKVSLHPDYFNHNAFYHVLQGVALFAIFVAARRLVQEPPSKVNYAHQT